MTPIQKPHPAILTHAQLVVASDRAKHARLPRNYELMRTCAGKVAALKPGDRFLWHSSKQAYRAAEDAGVKIRTWKDERGAGFHIIAI